MIDLYCVESDIEIKVAKTVKRQNKTRSGGKLLMNTVLDFFSLASVANLPENKKHN